MLTYSYMHILYYDLIFLFIYYYYYCNYLLLPPLLLFTTLTNLILLPLFACLCLLFAMASKKVDLFSVSFCFCFHLFYYWSIFLFYFFFACFILKNVTFTKEWARKRHRQRKTLNERYWLLSSCFRDLISIFFYSLLCVSCLFSFAFFVVVVAVFHYFVCPFSLCQAVITYCTCYLFHSGSLALLSVYTGRIIFMYLFISFFHCFQCHIIKECLMFLFFYLLQVKK